MQKKITICDLTGEQFEEQNLDEMTTIDVVVPSRDEKVVTSLDVLKEELPVEFGSSHIDVLVSGFKGGYSSYGNPTVIGIREFDSYDKNGATQIHSFDSLDLKSQMFVERVENYLIRCDEPRISEEK